MSLDANLKKKIFVVVQSVLLFVLYFLIQYRFLNSAMFDSDEAELFAGGMSIANGALLYGEFITQHMPVGFYISALLWKAGFQSIALQRIGFYIVYSFFWTMIFQRYKRVVSPIALFLYPIIFSCALIYYSFGSVVLSEHLAGIGLGILLLEYFGFCSNSKCLKWHNLVVISLSIVLSFGSLFIAIFSVFIIAFGVMLEELVEKRKVSEYCMVFVKKYIPLFFICALPWMILSIYYLAVGCLDRFIYWVYSFNRYIYSVYNGGYGSNIFESLLSTFNVWGGYIAGILNAERITYVVYGEIILMIFAIAYIFSYFKKEGIRRGVILSLFVIFAATRGLWDFHATQQVAVLSLLSSMFIVKSLSERKENFLKSPGLKLAFIIALFIVPAGYVSGISSIVSNEVTEEDNEVSMIIESVTEPGEYIWQSQLGTNHQIIPANRPIKYNAGGYPWYWVADGRDILSNLRENGLPRIALFSKDNTVWDIPVSEYGPDLIEFMDENYIQYKETNIYISRESYDEVIERIGN